MRLPINEDAFAQCQNISQTAYFLLNNKLATYTELCTDITLEDAFDLIEFHQVSEHNTALIEQLKRELSDR